MAFGQKTGSLKNLKKTLAKGGGGAYIKYIPKNGSMNVRFIQEPEEWVNYVEHFDTMMRKSFPCNGESMCPGCSSGERKSSRYLANAVDRDDKDRIIPLQMPKDLANRLVVRYERNGTLTDRDFELSRSGEGLDTVYDLDAMVVDRAKIDKFAPLDLLKVLEDAYNNVFGTETEEEKDGEDAPAPTPKPRGRGRSAAAAVAKGEANPDADEDDADEEEEEVAPEPVKKAAAPKAPEPEFVAEEDDEDDEPETADAPEEDDDDEEGEDSYTEEELRALPFGALRSVARDFGVATKGMDADAIIGAIMDSGDEADD